MKDPSELKPSTDLYEKIESESTGLGRLLGKIPGFDGYIERSRRREADQMLRRHVARLIEALRTRLANAQENMAHDINKAIRYAEPLGRADVCLRGLAGKLRDAPSGYAGFFDAVKIQEDELAEIYAFDESMLAHVDEIDTAVLHLEEALLKDGDVDAAISAVQTECREANAAYEQRHDLLKGIG